MVSGASITAYWLSSYAWEMVLYIVPLSLSMAVIYAVGIHTFTDQGSFFACFVLLLGYGWAIAPFTYVASFLYDKHTKAQIFTVLFNIFLGLVLMIAQYVMSLIGSTKDVNRDLMNVYRL
jgi:hypothetical protein